MLSRGKIRGGNARYYADSVASGVEDYMTGAGEAPGRWDGAGAAAEGLDGEVTTEHIELLFEGDDARHPLTGEVLGRRYDVKDGYDKVMGWDLTVSAPKSFSVLWAVAEPEVAKVLDQIHAAAVHETIAYLEDHSAFSRTGRGGVAQVDTKGLLIARFEHRTSRAMDPQRHSHLLVSNRVRCTDGVWRAVDSRAMHPQLKPAGTVYHAALRAEATARLGIEWGPVNDHGQADIAGVPEGLLVFWSKRRRTVERAAKRKIGEREAELGRTLTDAERRDIYQRATLDTRTTKRRDEALPANIHDLWRLDAQAAGFAVDDWFDRVLSYRARVEQPQPDPIVDDVLADLERKHSTWDRTDVVERVAARLPAGLALSATEARVWVEHLADQVIAHEQVVRLARAPIPSATGFERRDGRSVYEPHNDTRYTTHLTLALEQHVLDTVIDGREARSGIASPDDVEDAIAAHGLSEDQAQAVERLTLGGDAVICLVGPAGTGKTRTIGAAADAWDALGYPVRGLAVSAVAADVLAHEARIPADTVDKLLYEHDRADGPGSRWQLHPGEVVIVDEASQLATADLVRLLDLVRAVDGKLVLVGDHRQLGAVDAGGLFRLLANDGIAIELTGVWRFTHEWERDASLGLRYPDTRVLDEYEAHDRFRAGTREQMLDCAYRSWVEARADSVSMVVMATDHATVDTLAMRIRASRVEAHQVEPNGLEVGEQTIGVGDEIVTLRNDRRLVTNNDHWVRNGDRWRVERRTLGGGLRVLSLDDRGRAYLPPDYASEHVALSYAVTLHKAQGMTVDHGIVLADETTSELGLYVGMTRGRHANHALVATDAGQPEHQRWRDLPTAKDVLARVLDRDTAERSATEALRETLGPEGYDRLSARLEHLIGTVERHGGRDTGDQRRWLDDHEDVRNLRDILSRGFDDRFGRGDDRYAEPELPGWGRSEPEPPGMEIDVGPDLW